MKPAGDDGCTPRMCGGTLARAHARSGDRIAIASYLGNSDVFDRAIADVLRGLRRPERARLPSTGPSRGLWPGHCTNRLNAGARRTRRARARAHEGRLRRVRSGPHDLPIFTPRDTAKQRWIS